MRARNKRKSIPIVNARNINKVFHKKATSIHVLKNVSLNIEKGEFVSVMGPSGSGKSTLLYILGCLSRPSSGDYSLLGMDVKNLSDKKLSNIRASRIGFVFQTYNLLSQYTVLENVKMPFLYNKHNKEDVVHSKAINAIENVNLSERQSHFPSELSGGELQRVAIARAIVINPDLLLADEPTGNLDSKTGEDIIRLFQSLNKSGRTILMVTHNEQVATFANRRVYIMDGKISHD